MTVTNYLWSEDSYLEEYNESGQQIISYTNEPAAFGGLGMPPKVDPGL